MSTEDPSSRHVLEERITHCEHLVDALNRVVADLQKRALALELQNRNLIAAFKQQQEAARSFGLADEKPPHY